jgi:hypothetical protein
MTVIALILETIDKLILNLMSTGIDVAWSRIPTMYSSHFTRDKNDTSNLSSSLSRIGSDMISMQHFLYYLYFLLMGSLSAIVAFFLEWLKRKRVVYN